MSPRGPATRIRELESELGQVKKKKERLGVNSNEYKLALNNTEKKPG